MKRLREVAWFQKLRRTPRRLQVLAFGALLLANSCWLVIALTVAVVSSPLLAAPKVGDLVFRLDHWMFQVIWAGADGVELLQETEGLDSSVD